MSRSESLLWTTWEGIRKYTIAVLAVTVAMLLPRWSLLHLMSAQASLFYSAVMLSAWFGGFGPGYLATALATFVFYYNFLPPVDSLTAKPEEIPRLIVFAASAFFVATLSAAQRRAAESLRRARDELLGTVQELQKTNKALQAESRERKQADEKLRRSEAYLSEAQRLSHTGSWAWNVATREIVHGSQEYSRLFGFDPEARPHTEAILQRIHPDDRGRVRETWDRAVRERCDYKMDYRIALPGVAVKYVHGVGHPVFNEAGDLLEFIGTSIDVTERKQADEKLRQAQADLARASRVTTMGELSASLAHEMKQPIAAAITDANTCVRWLTRDQPDLEEARAAALRVVKDATRASEIVSHVRLLFKKGSTQREPVDVNEIIREMIVLLHNETTRYSIVVQTKLAEDLPKIMGDRVQLQQVMMNLILNSIEAMRDVDGARELTIKSEPAENGKIMISVSDTGVGLPTQEMDQLFNAFFTTKDHGTGMGLSISRSIVESHEGRLWAAGNSPRGANFYFTLPASVEGHE